MRLVTFLGTDGRKRLGALQGDQVVDLNAVAQNAGVLNGSFQSMATFLHAGQDAMLAVSDLVKNAGPSAIHKLADVRLRAPVPRPGKIIAVGLNYRDHASEAGAKALPAVPMIFAKFPTSICGPNEAIVLPQGNPNVDYEAELAVVIGRRGKTIAARAALEYVAGYMPLNDVSARAWQFADKQWVRGKSCDTFCPTGPWLTTREEVEDPHALSIRTRVNGTTLQDSNTNRLIFKVPELIEFISASITLEPGDIIATGTPEGVGAFRNPPIFLKEGDVVEVEIEKLGILTNPVVAA